MPYSDSRVSRAFIGNPGMSSRSFMDRALRPPIRTVRFQYADWDVYDARHASLAPDSETRRNRGARAGRTTCPSGRRVKTVPLVRSWAGGRWAFGWRPALPGVETARWREAFGRTVLGSRGSLIHGGPTIDLQVVQAA